LSKIDTLSFSEKNPEYIMSLSSSPHQRNVAASPLVDSAVGCLVGHMIGDALGACVEGWTPRFIRILAKKMNSGDVESKSDYAQATGHSQKPPETKSNDQAKAFYDTPLIGNFIPCIHMGHPLIGYVGPVRRSADEKHARCGMYSDDTNACLALANSLIEKRGLDGAHAAKRYAEFYYFEAEEADVQNERTHLPETDRRFCPPTAENVMKSVLFDGVDYKVTGLPPYFPYQDGSFANGGAMRISGLGIAFRNAGRDVFRRAVAEAIQSSHVHPEAVDGACVQAMAVRVGTKFAVASKNTLKPIPEFREALLAAVEDVVETPVFKKRISAVRSCLQTPKEPCRENVKDSTLDDIHVLKSKILNDGVVRPGSSFSFQIAAIDMIPCVLWIALKYAGKPEEAVMRAIAIGGDTDTCAALVSAIMGALHGANWIPDRWWNGVENGQKTGHACRRGRDYTIALAKELADLDVTHL